MEKNSHNMKSFWIICLFILGAFLSRFFSHPPNFSPVMAVSLFGAVFFDKKLVAYLVPVAIMLISDIFLGLHSTIPFVYGSFILVVFLGTVLRNKRIQEMKPGAAVFNIAGFTLTGSFLFFVITNFGAWMMMTSLYEPSFAGLLECFVAAIPFYHNSLAGDLMYSTLLFGGYLFANKKFIARKSPLQIQQTIG